MLNAEKHRDQLLKFVEENHNSLFGLDKNSGPISCVVSRCNNCQFGFKKNNYIEGYSCSAAKVKWLLAEYKEPIKLSRLEHELLKFINNEGYKYIARDNCGGVLFRYPEKPTKNIYGEWGKGGICSDLRMFNDLFQFVKWEDEEPTLIKDALDKVEY